MSESDTPDTPETTAAAPETAAPEPLRRLRIVGDGPAHHMRILLDGVEVRRCLSATLEMNANGVGAERFPILTLRVLCAPGLEVEMDAVVREVPA